MTTPTDQFALQLARVEVKIDQILTESGDHEARLRKLEERRWPLPVVACVCSVAAVVLSLAPLVVR